MDILRDMRNNKDMLDVTLVCDDSKVDAHKLVLSACSSFFRQMMFENPDCHTFIFLNGVLYRHLSPLLDLMYTGEVHVLPEDLAEFLELAQALGIEGMVEISHYAIGTTASPSIVNSIPEDLQIYNQESFIISEAEEDCQNYRLIHEKMAKLGVKENRRYFCKDCEKIGSKVTIYKHIAVKHLNINQNIKENGKEDSSQKKHKVNLGLRGFDDSFEPVFVKSDVSKKHKNNTEDLEQFANKISKKVKFASNNAVEVINERQGSDSFENQLFAQNYDIENEETNDPFTSGIISATNQGFILQEEPQKIVDIFDSPKKPICEKIVMLSTNKYKCKDCGEKGGKRKMYNHI